MAPSSSIPSKYFPTPGPALYFTSSPGGAEGVELTLPEHTQDETLKDSANLILSTYSELLSFLDQPRVQPDTYSPGQIRLQNALAAACEGLSPSQFRATTAAQLRRFREKHLSPGWTKLAPSLVVYIGPRTSNTSPSTTGDLKYSNRPLGALKLADKVWFREGNGTGPTAWAWSVRSKTEQSKMIFLSGGYALWQSKDQSRRIQLEQEIILVQHLKITLFHELAYRLRLLAYGTEFSAAPERCVDSLQDSSSKGDEGRLAEELAFGAVVNLARENRLLKLFFDYKVETEVHTAPKIDAYELMTSDSQDLFSHQATDPPINPTLVAQRQKRLILSPDVRNQRECETLVEKPTPVAHANLSLRPSVRFYPETPDIYRYMKGGCVTHG